MPEPTAPLDLLNRVDPRVHDTQALEEIELYAELMIVAAASRRVLTPAEIDQVLGVGGTAVDAEDGAP